MKLLFTGDWQLDVSNLDTAATMVKEVKAICQREQVNTIVNTGDMKNKYSPIDGRVLNFGVDVCADFKKEGLTQYLLLGNHDRYGLHSDVVSWLPVLRQAGAKTFDTLGIERIENSYLAFLPFTTSTKQFRKKSARLAAMVKHPDKTILTFHQDVRECRYNVLVKSEGHLKVQDLHPEKYWASIGGHIHLQQQVSKRSNVWFAGSPFAMDWGEANQRKGYLLVDTNEHTVTRIESEIPRLYDVDWPGFKESKPKSWKGALIRVRVLCEKGEDIEEKAASARSLFEGYTGAELVIVPKFAEDLKAEVVDMDASGQTRLRNYVEQTCPEPFRGDQVKLLSYLKTRLTQAGLQFTKPKKVEFISGHGENFLSYKELDVDYTTPGVTLVTGKNRSWPGRSNGSGKTNYAQLLAVSLAGSTFKGQTHDKWSKRNSQGRSVASSKFKVDGMVYEAWRERKPSALHILDSKGADISTGNKAPEAQRQLEELTGFSWETLSAVLYVDQRNQNSLLLGTDSQRKDILEKLQHLEKYKEASTRIKKDIADLYNATVEATQRLEIDKNTLQHVREQLDSINSLTTDKDAVKRQYTQMKQDLQRMKKPVKQEARRNVLLKAKSTLDKEVQGHFITYKLLTGEMSKVLGRLKRLQTIEGHQCPTCEQQVRKSHVSAVKRELVLEKTRLRSKEIDAKTKMEDTRTALVGVKKELEDLEYELGEAEIARDNFEQEFREVEAAYRKVASYTDLKQDSLRKRREAKADIARCQEVLRTLKYEEAFLQYCLKVVSRNGLPAFLNAQSCPALNRYADHYAELFTDGQIKVRFNVDEAGAFKVTVHNVSGGEHVIDQSAGETRLASLVTSFAARDTFAPCNLLILDEPGEGLDSTNAQLFAKKLAGLGSKIGTVIVISHNPYMIAELGTCNHVEIEKRKGTSHVVQS